MPKPTSFAAWTVGNPNFGLRTVEPSAPKKQQGWLADEFPPSEYHNWLFWNADQWAQWHARAGGADFIVGDEAIDDFTDLASAVAAASAGQTIRVKKDLTLSATVVISLANLRILFDPGVTMTNSASGVGLQLDAVGIRLDGGRMSGFSGGDKGIEVTIGSDYCSITGFRFDVTTTTDIDDLSGTASVTSKINE